MPFPKGAQKGKDQDQQQQADLTVCGLCSGSFAEDEERIEARCSACGTRAFHPACVTDRMDKEIRTLVKDKRQQERGRLWARNHPEQIFCRNGHIKHIPACPQDGCSGSMEAAELVKPRKPAQEEEPPNAPPPPEQQQRGPKPKAKQPKAAAEAGQATAAGQGVPRKAVASSLKASAAPHAQLGGSASLSRSSNLSQSSTASGTPTFAQQQLAEARAAAAAARAQLAAARGGHGSGSLGAAAARGGSAAGSRASAGRQLARPGSGASAASSSVWTGAPSAALEAEEDYSEEEEEQPPPLPPPRAPTPDFSQEAWPELGGGSQPAARGSGRRVAASGAQQADSGDARGGFGVVQAVTPEQQEGYLRMLVAMEAEEQHWHEQQQQQQPPAWEPSAQPGWDAQYVHPPSPVASAAAAAAEAAAAPRPVAQPAAFQEEWEDTEEGDVDAASLAALLRRQQQAFQQQLAAGQSGWEQAAGGQPGTQVLASVPLAAPSLWEQPISPAAPAVPAQQDGSLWDQPAAAVVQPAPLLPPAPAPAPAAPAWDGSGAARAALMPDEWAQTATAAAFAGYAVQSAKVAQAHLAAVQQEQPQPAAWEQPGQSVEWAQPAAAAVFAGYSAQPSAHVPARFAGIAEDFADYSIPAAEATPAVAYTAAAPAFLGAAATAPAGPQQQDAQAEVDELMQLLGIA